MTRIWTALCAGARGAIEEELLPYRRSLGLRLRRDITRVRDYYGSLVREAESKIRKNRTEMGGRIKPKRLGGFTEIRRPFDVRFT